MARKIPKNYRHITGRVSDGAGGALPFEGPLEIHFYTLMTHQRSIRRIETQSITIEHRTSEGRKTRYTPEALIHFDERLGLRPMLVEVKPTKTLKKDWQEIRLKVRAGIRHARAEGWTFKVYTEREICTPYLENVKLLRIHRGQDFPAEQLAPIRALVDAAPGISLDALLQKIHPRRQGDEWLEVLSKVYYLLATGQLSTDLFKPIGYATSIEPAGTWTETPWDKRWLRKAAPPPRKVRKGW